jgi:hypothetical protein
MSSSVIVWDKEHLVYAIRVPSSTSTEKTDRSEERGKSAVRSPHPHGLQNHPLALGANGFWFRDTSNLNSYPINPFRRRKSLRSNALVELVVNAVMQCSWTAGYGYGNQPTATADSSVCEPPFSILFLDKGLRKEARKIHKGFPRSSIHPLIDLKVLPERIKLMAKCLAPIRPQNNK